MKAVEIRVRELCGFADDLTGVDPINRTFGPIGQLTDSAAVRGEQEGTRLMFAGALTKQTVAGNENVDNTGLEP